GSRSALPVVRSIVTAPMVARNGTVLAGVGLDRDIGLFYCIDPGLFACLADFYRVVTADGDAVVKSALEDLINDSLIDVNTSRSGKLLLVMRCLHKIQRLLLAERPAWSIKAAKAAAGKTTAIKMATMAVDGRLANAATWSNTEEERRKALYAYFRQGLGELTWDNMRRGTVVDCPN